MTTNFVNMFMELAAGYAIGTPVHSIAVSMLVIVKLSGINTDKTCCVSKLQKYCTAVTGHHYAWH